MADRPHSRRRSGSGATFDPSSDPRLEKELARLHGNSFGINESNESLFFNNSLEAYSAFKVGKWKPEQATHVAFNLSLITDLMKHSNAEALEIIKTAAEGGPLSVAVNKRQDHPRQHRPVSIPPAGKMRPLTAAERLEAKSMGLQAKEWYEKVGRQRDLSIEDLIQPVTAQQIFSPITGNGISEPGQFKDNDPAEESPEIIRDKRINTQLGSDTIETSNDREPRSDGQNAPNRHNQASLTDLSKHIEALRKELAEAERQHIEVVVVGKVADRIRTYLKKSPHEGERLMEAVLRTVDSFDEGNSELQEVKQAQADTVVNEPIITDEDIAVYLRDNNEPS